MKPSARRIRALAVRFCSSATVERLIDPILTDIELEYRESCRSGRVWLARWALLRGYFGLCSALALHRIHVCARSLMLDDATKRTMAFTVAAFVLLTFALVLPPLLKTKGPAELSLYSVPQAIPLCMPIALAFGIACGWTRDATARAMLRRVLTLAIASIVLALATMEWLVPAADRGFRAAVFSRSGVQVVGLHSINERSLSELAALIRQTSASRPVADDEGSAAQRELSAADRRLNPRTLEKVFHLKVAICLATAPLAFLAVTIASVMPRRNLARGVFAGIVLLYVAAYPAVPTIVPTLSPSAEAWLPNTGLAAVSLLLLCVSSIRRRV